MRVFITQLLFKQLSLFKGQTIYTNYQELIDFLLTVKNLDELDQKKAFGFKKFKGIRESKMYGFDVNKQQGGERLISTLIDKKSGLYTSLKLSDREPTFLFHRIVKHDEQSLAASHDAKKNHSSTDLIRLSSEVETELVKD